MLGFENVLPYDTRVYAHSLAYLGEPLEVPGLPWPVIKRGIPTSDHFDVIGPWPYGSPIDPAGVPEALGALRAAGAVTFVAFLRPDCEAPVEALQAAGLGVLPLKPHFMFAADAPPLAPSKKTRFNLNAARRRWAVQPLDLAAHWPAVAALHRELALRRTLSHIAHVDDAHFESLARVPGAAGLGVFDGEVLVAALIVALDAGSVHFHAIVGNELAYRERAFYALYDEALRRWGAARLVCMGGAPSAAEGEGIAKFKQRFANQERPVLMVTATLDEAACAALTAQHGAARFFPPYRTAAG
jgi:hypothetical protein